MSCSVQGRLKGIWVHHQLAFCSDTVSWSRRSYTQSSVHTKGKHGHRVALETKWDLPLHFSIMVTGVAFVSPEEEEWKCLNLFLFHLEPGITKIPHWQWICCKLSRLFLILSHSWTWPDYFKHLLDFLTTYKAYLARQTVILSFRRL